MHSVHISHRHAVPKDSCSGSNRSSQALPSSVIFKHCLQYQQHSPNSATDRPVKRGTGHIPASHSQVEAQQAARLAVFVSGGGSNLKAIHKRIIQGKLCAVIQVILVVGHPRWHFLATFKAFADLVVRSAACCE